MKNKKILDRKSRKRKHFYSVYAAHIEELILLKRQLGHKYNTGAVILAQIDQLALQRDEIGPGITKPFADQWQRKLQGTSSSYHYSRIRYLAQLSSFILDKGITSYIPKLPPYPEHNFVPYIYTRAEMSALFKALDRLQMSVVASNCCLICVPAIIRLLYATGLRVGEVVALKQADMNLAEHCLVVTDSKNGKERMIPIDPSLVEVCRTYQKYRNRLDRSTESDFFFIRPNGHPCSTHAIRQWFKKGLQIAKIAHKGRIHNGVEYAPRLHDLRHSFAVTALASMSQAGLDLYVALPILSNYLGHQSIRATDHYVRLTQSHYPDILQKMDAIYLDVFPDFSSFEIPNPQSIHQNDKK